MQRYSRCFYYIGPVKTDAVLRQPCVFTESAVLDRSLCGSKAGDRNAERAAGHVVQTDFVAELDGAGVAAVLAADAEVQLRTGCTAKLCSHVNELADTGLVETCKRIALVDLLVIVCTEELAGVVTAEAEGHLGQVIGAEGEELSLSCDLVSGESGSGDLDHSADKVLHVGAGVSNELVCNGGDNILDVLELLDLADQRDHDLGNEVPLGMTCLNGKSCLDNGTGLHLCDLGEGDSQTAAAVTHHRVELVQGSNDVLDLLNGLALCLCKSLDVSFLSGNELVERRIQEADGYGVAAHCLVDALEVALLHRLELCKSCNALFLGVGADHFTESSDTVAVEEHVLGTGKADALCAQLTRLLRERGAEVVLGDSPGEPFTSVVLGRVYSLGDYALCEAAGGELNRDFSHHTVEFPDAVTVKSFEYSAWLEKCDAVINFSKLKAHGLMGMTAAVKNLYGVIPGTVKSEYHFRYPDPMAFANMLVDLNEFVRPALCLCDAVDIMEGNGPTQGTPRHMGALLAATSSYELDRLCAWMLGLEEKELPYLTAAKQRRLLSEAGEPLGMKDAAPYHVNDFARSGATSSWFVSNPNDKPFRKLVKKCVAVLLRSKPALGEGCTGCGHCARLCPAGAITIVNKHAVIDRKKCVRCFCCQEFCPSGAMRAQRSFVARLLSK